MAQPPMIGLCEFRLETQLILLDLEFTCWEDSLRTNWLDVEKPPEVIEIGAAVYDVAGDSILDHFTSLVRPKRNPELSTYCQDLLNISQADVSRAPLLDSVVAQIADWKKQRDLVGTPTCSWGVNDRLFLARDARRSNCQDPFDGCRHVDLRSLFRVALGYPTDGACDRDRLRAVLGLMPNARRHRALDDTLDLAQFCRRMRAQRVYPGVQYGKRP